MTANHRTMKKGVGRIGGIQRFSVNDGPGIRTTVFFKGCPLKCQWCHNPELIPFQENLMYTANRCIRCGACFLACPQKARKWEGETAHVSNELCQLCLTCVEACPAKALRSVVQEMTVSEVMEIIDRDALYYEESGGGVTLSGGEVLSQADFAKALTEECCNRGYSVALDTSGYGDAEQLLAIAEKASHILFDIKAGREESHLALTGVSLKPIRDNLDLLAADPKLSNKVILRMPLIHQVNDTEEEIEGTCRYLAGKGFSTVNLLPYHDLGLSKNKSMGQEGIRFSEPPARRLYAIACKFESIGIHATGSKGEDLKEE